MSYAKLNLPPGVRILGTAYQSAGRWQMSNMIRFFSGTIRPVGGWVYVTGDTDSVLESAGRGVTTWRDNTGQQWAGIGTVNALYGFDGSSMNNITPSGFPAGNVDAAIVAGYGAGAYGSGVYGGTGAGVLEAPTTWSLDHFGQDLVACASHDRKIYEWTLNPSSLPTQVANSPLCNACFVTAEGFLVAVGAANPRNIAWSDQRNDTVWAASATNQAGDLDLQSSGIFLKGLRVRGQSLLLSTVDAWTMNYIGPQLVYSFQQAGDKCGLIGPLAAVGAEGGAYWMGSNGFYHFNGTQVVGVDCEVHDFIFSNINLVQRAKVCCGQNSEFNEITWWWCSAGSTTIDMGATYNYAEGHWAVHQTPYLRSCYTDADAFDWPIAVSDSGRAYYQENGWTANGQARTSQVFVQSAPVELGNGDQTYMIRQVLPDELTPGAWTASFQAQFTPEDATAQQVGPLTLTPYTDVRLSGRQMSCQLEAAIDSDIRVGTFRIDSIAASGR